MTPKSYSDDSSLLEPLNKSHHYLFIIHSGRKSGFIPEAFVM